MAAFGLAGWHAVAGRRVRERHVPRGWGRWRRVRAAPAPAGLSHARRARLGARMDRRARGRGDGRARGRDHERRTQLRRGRRRRRRAALRRRDALDRRHAARSGAERSRCGRAPAPFRCDRGHCGDGPQPVERVGGAPRVHPPRVRRRRLVRRDAVLGVVSGTRRCCRERSAGSWCAPRDAIGTPCSTATAPTQGPTA